MYVYGFFIFFFLMIRRQPRSTRTDTLFPYTTLFRSAQFAVLRNAEAAPVHLGDHCLRRLVGVARGAQELVHREVVLLAVVRVRSFAPPADVGVRGEESGREHFRRDAGLADRSEERRVGKACVRSCRSRW